MAREIESAGAILCAEHARQAQREEAVHGDCQPSQTWSNGFGNPVTCDMVDYPERVQSFLASLKERSENWARYGRHDPPKHRRTVAARGRAQTELARRHPEEFEAIFAAECADD